MKIIQSIFLTCLLFSFPALLFGQNSAQTSQLDSALVEKESYYKTAEIAYQMESTSRYIKDKTKQIQNFENTDNIDTAFNELSVHIKNDFEEFEKFNKLNLSKFFLLNKKRVWLNYKSQLTNWQTDLTGRITELMQISERIKEKEKLWVTTSNQHDNQLLPKQIRSRIDTAIKDLHELEKKLFEVVGELSITESELIDQILHLEQQISVIDELHKNYRVNVFKSTRPVLWKISLKDTFEGKITERLEKAWYENSKSFKDSLPSLKEYWGNFIWWSLFFALLIFGLRHLYLKQKLQKEDDDKDELNELIVNNQNLTVLYLIIFVFIVLFVNIPLALSGLISLMLLVVAFFLLKSYFSYEGKRLILTFIVLSIANTLEIVLWYFGDFARLFLLFEAGLGIYLVYFFVSPAFSKNYKSVFRYKLVVNLLRYPIFLTYVIALFVNLFGYMNLTVLLLKIGTQVSSVIIMIIAGWEISKSLVFVLFRIMGGLRHKLPNKYLPLIRKRMVLFISLFLIYILLDGILRIIELDAPFDEMIDRFMNNDRTIGSFVFTYSAIYHFLLIMLIAWGLSSVVRIIFDEGNYKKSYRMRGVPAAISMTLRLIIAMSGFFLALSGAGIDLTKISILFGAFGVGIGFGLQNIVNNFISGLILIYERPIQAGDTIEINTLMGEVKSIGIRSSKVKTFDGAEVVVPNSMLVSDQLINWTLSDDRRRIELIIGVKYGTDPQKVIEILKNVASKHEMVSKDPAPRVLFNEFADSSLNFRLLFWVLFEHGIQTKSDIAVAIDKAFKENKIEIPFPQLDLHVIDTPVEKATFASPLESKSDSKPLIADDSGKSEEDETRDETN